MRACRCDREGHGGAGDPSELGCGRNAGSSNPTPTFLQSEKPEEVELGIGGSRRKPLWSSSLS